MLTDNIIMAIGLAGAFFTTFAYLPQSIKTIRTKHTKDLSLPMLVMLEIGLVCWLIYGLIIWNIPIICANTISIVFMSVILVMKLRYG